jgi:hypothetical protein
VKYKYEIWRDFMAEMIRKQMYIQKQQERLLKQLSRARGVSEAEIIRQAIEREAAGEKHYLPAPDPEAWQEILRFVEGRKAHNSRSRPYRWARQDAYREREKCFPPRSGK